MQGEPARRRKTRGALEAKAALGEGLANEALQILGRLRLHAGGDLFAEKFEKKLGHRAGVVSLGADRGSADRQAPSRKAER